MFCNKRGKQIHLQSQSSNSMFWNKRVSLIVCNHSHDDIYPPDIGCFVTRELSKLCAVKIMLTQPIVCFVKLVEDTIVLTYPMCCIVTRELSKLISVMIMLTYTIDCFVTRAKQLFTVRIMLTYPIGCNKRTKQIVFYHNHPIDSFVTKKLNKLFAFTIWLTYPTKCFVVQALHCLPFIQHF